MLAWYACIYYAACRPGELRELHAHDLVLPDDGWGELTLAGNDPHVIDAWHDDGVRSARQLKQRAPGDTRPVPAHPLLCALLRSHLAQFGSADDGRIFPGRGDGPISQTWHLTVWAQARRAALSPAEQASPLARRPYDLRHACLTGWLNAGVPVTTVAGWAGHDPAVLLSTYAGVLVGQDDLARRLIDAQLTATMPADDPVHAQTTADGGERQSDGV
jgi:integrase